MKLRNTVLAFSAVTAIALSGCGGNNAQPTAVQSINDAPTNNPDQCQRDGANAPAWICNPYMEGGLTAIGSAERSPLGEGHQRVEAESQARDSLARQLNTRVKNMFKNFSQQTGVGDNQSIEKVTTNVSKQVAKIDLSGAIPRDSWQNPKTGALYVRLVLNPAATKKVAEQVKETVKSSLRSQEHLYQQFVAKKAHEELDAQIDKEFSGE
jgi:ribosomal protein S20